MVVEVLQVISLISQQFAFLFSHVLSLCYTERPHKGLNICTQRADSCLELLLKTLHDLRVLATSTIERTFNNILPSLRSISTSYLYFHIIKAATLLETSSLIGSENFKISKEIAKK